MRTRRIWPPRVVSSLVGFFALDECLIDRQVYRPTLRQKSDADILREAKMEAMGIPVQDDVPRTSQQERAQMASDEIVSVLYHFLVKGFVLTGLR
jgi:hypothetical protein